MYLLTLIAALCSISAAIRKCNPENLNPGNGFYKTVANDDVNSIAADFRESVNKLVTDNHLSGTTKLAAGLELKVRCPRSCRHIPKEPGIGWYWVVQGDQLNSISTDFGDNTDDIVRRNQRLISNKDSIPSWVNIKVRCKRGCRPDPRDPSSGWYWTVAEDNLPDIAKDFGESIDDIIQANNWKDTTPFRAYMNLKVRCVDDLPIER